MVAINRVIIVGGGIGGLTLAAALGNRGAAVRVVERDNREDRLGTGISLLGNALRALDRIGLAERCIAAGAGFDKVITRDSQGNLLNEFCPPRTFRADQPGAVGIMRPLLADMLEEEALSGGATIDFGTTVTSIDQVTNSVKVALSDGTVCEADLLVACDGAYSITRRLVFGDEHQPVYSGQGAWRYTAPRPSNMSGITFYRATDGTVLGGIPIAGDLCYYFTLENADRRPRFPTPELGELFRRRMAPFSAPELAEAAARITEDSAISFRPFDILLMDSPWHRGNVVLLGDAAHSLTPQLTSGGGMAIEDAVVLAEALNDFDCVKDALVAYSQRRYARVEPIYATSKAISENERFPAADPERSMTLLRQGQQLLAGPF